MASNLQNPDQNPRNAQGAKQRDLSRYESSPARILQSLGIVVLGGIVLVLLLKYVVGW
ncbi:MAG: hypothetical protein PHF00_11120 [Elusimicrobia bacterium]|nr:hypothetical protein [Elusimicrobiota bacterium]